MGDTVTITKAEHDALLWERQFWRVAAACRILVLARGVAETGRIGIGAREFMCIGAKPPFDHPHVFLDMGSDDEIVCPYCSTLFKYEPSLGHGHCKPAECEYHDTAAKAA